MHHTQGQPRRPRSIRRTEFERIAQLGIFDGQRVELLNGAIVEMSPIGPEHGEAVDRTMKKLVPRSAKLRLAHFPDVELALEELMPKL